jgi:hypothetical protein
MVPSLLRALARIVPLLLVLMSSNDKNAGVVAAEEDHLFLRTRNHCGGVDHTELTRPCKNNDTDCGSWNGRWWNPHNCHYRDVSSQNAQKCLGNRTIACIGDSMIRDICQGIVHLLLGKYDTLETLRSGKFDYDDMNEDGTIIKDFPFWKHNVPPHNFNGYIYPKLFNESYASHKWQLQMWSLYRREFLYDGQHVQIMQNKMVGKMEGLRPIDFLLMNYGLHDYGWFDSPPRGQKYVEALVSQDFVKHIPEAKMPMVWVTMNKNCESKLRKEDRDRDQHGMVDDANKYANEYFLRHKLPYWDANAVLRTEKMCEHSDDGVHVNQYVDIMRAKMLFNHLCDHHWTWKEHPLKHFV